MKKVKWFARGGGIARCGPFKSEIEAWEHMRYTDDFRRRTRLDHPPDTTVWPERAS